MFKSVRLKSVSLILIFSFILFYSPYLLAGQTEQIKGKGNLIGKIYAKDGVTAVVGALAKIKNVATAKVYESSKTNNVGTFKIEGIEEGLYSLGIVTDEGEFNVESLIGVKANKAVLITLVLKPYLEEGKVEVRSKIVKSDKAPSKILKFFSSPIGIAIIVVGSVAIIYGIVTLTGEEEEVSPFRE